MKQLLIVNSAKTSMYSTGKPFDLGGLGEGQLAAWELGADAFLSAAAAKNFALAIGRPTGTPAFVIPEIDFATLHATVSEYQAAANSVFEITIPAPPENLLRGYNYSIIITNKTAVFNERYQWTATTFVPLDSSKDEKDIAEDLCKQLKNKAEFGNIPFDIEVSGAKITLTVLDNSRWQVTAGDDLFGTEVKEKMPWAPGIGDKAYVQELARKCAGGKGFLYTGDESRDLYPGFPEAVEDKEYTVFNLAFATGRTGQKTTDERVWQYVHIAVPSDCSSVISTLTTILGDKLEADEAEAEQQGGGGGQ